MFYTVYKTTFIPDGRYYIGVHKTTNPSDGYLGSGIHIKAAVKKYGQALFKKEVLHVFETAAEAYARERELVSKELLTDSMFNKTTGGSGGDIDWSSRSRKILSGAAHPQFGKCRTADEKKRTSDSLKRTYKENPRDPASWEKAASKKRGVPSPLKGTTQSAESNAKRSASHRSLEKLQCPHCHGTVSPQNLKRFHGDRCPIVTGVKSRSKFIRNKSATLTPVF
jgi:hypothetical protein